MSSLANIILFAALVITSVCVVMMYLKLKRLEIYHAEYKRTIDATAASLDAASQAVRNFRDDGRQVLEALAGRIEVAKTVIAELEKLTGQAGSADRSVPRSNEYRPEREPSLNP